MIRTISDLNAASEEEVERALGTIKIREHYYRGTRMRGRSVGLTMDEYKAWQAEPATETCHSCSGTGKFKEGKRSVGTIHASSAHTCRLRLYYDVVAEHPPKQEFAPELLITFAMGHAIHDVVQKALHASLPGLFQDEVRVDFEEAFVINSRTDGVIELPDARVLLEIKSIGSEFDTLTEPKKDHLTQAMGIYATALDVPFVSFLYVSKKWPHSVKEFVLPYNHRVYKRWWRNKGEKVEQALATGTPPIADADKKTCQQCPYNYFCPQRAK